MSGIIGMLNLTTESHMLSNENLIELNEAMLAQKHRGLDSSGVYGFVFKEEETVAHGNTPLELLGNAHFDGVLAYNHFATKEIYKSKILPFYSRENRIIVALDGEIYNSDELFSDLQYCEKRTYIDEEIISELYLKYGFEKMVSKLNGMFTIVLVDLKKQTIFLARDRMGIKPLYVSFYRDRLFFASELKCFTFFKDFKRELDLDAFNARLVFSRPGDKVLFKNVFILNPGEFIVSKFNGVSNQVQYFDINEFERNANYNSVKDALFDFEGVLEEAINRQLKCDVPFMTQVSGGIDSTLVNYFIKSIKGDDFTNGISIVDGSGDLGEEYWINKVRDALNLNIDKHQLDEEFFNDNYLNLVWHNDAPLYKPYFTSFYKMAHSAKGKAKVLFSGEGADETAGGYGRFAAGLFQPFFTKNNISGKNIKTYSSYAEYAICSDSTIKKIPVLKNDNTDDLIKEQIDNFMSFTGSNFEKQLKYETKYRLTESFMRQEKMASANSVEIRVPLVDNKVYDFIATLPERLLMSFAAPSPMQLSENPFEWIQGKYIMKELCAQKFGRDFAYRNKQIIVFDERAIIKSKEFRRLLLEKTFPSMRDRGLLDVELITNWYENSATITQQEFNIMWRAIGLEHWCELFLDK